MFERILVCSTAAAFLLSATAAAAETRVAAPAGFAPQQAIAFGAEGAVATGVDAGHPLPVILSGGEFGVSVESAAPSTSATSIAAAASLSGAIDLDRQRLHRVLLPAGWTSAAITFQSSVNGTTWSDLYDRDGEVTLAATVVGAGRAIVVDAAAFLGVRYLKIRSGTAAVPVAQAAQRDLTLSTVAR